MPASTRAFALLVDAGLGAVLVWSMAHPSVRVPASERVSAVPVGVRIDPNTADAATLQLLPGVGPSIAQNIVNARQQGAVFRNAQDLQAVRFIGPGLLKRVALWVVYAGASPTPHSVASGRKSPPTPSRPPPPG